MKKPIFFVIGSNCFSGSYFVNKALNAGYQVYGMSRSDEPNDIFLPYKWNKIDKLKFGKNIEKFHFYKLNINTDLQKIIKLINDVEPSHVINFAAQGMVAQSWEKPIDWYQTNLISQVAFHDELRKCAFLKKYIHVTTPEVYGDTSNKWIKEKYEFHPSTPYAVSRASCDLHLLSFFKAYQFPVVFTRAANVFGPGQQLYRIIPRAILSALTGKKMSLHGGGVSCRSFIHIQDVVDGTMKIALEGKPGNTWHISTKSALSILELVNKISEITNVSFEKFVDIGEERLGKDQNYFLDSGKLRSDFNWEDNIKLEDGIKETIRWVEMNLDIMLDMSWDYIHKK